jgi:hypothetical protein
MGKFAVLEGTLVVNLLEAESLEIVEFVTKKTAIESTLENPAIIGGSYDFDTKQFIKPQPYPSWSLNQDNVWEAPVAKPDLNFTYEWDEESVSWVKQTPNIPEEPQPYPSWVKNSVGIWIAPVEVPDISKDYTWDESTRSWKELSK